MNEDICQIADYAEAATGTEIEVCPNAASHVVGLTICSATFQYKLCSDCQAFVLKEAKTKMRQQLQELSRLEARERYR